MRKSEKGERKKIQIGNSSLKRARNSSPNEFSLQKLLIRRVLPFNTTVLSMPCHVMSPRWKEEDWKHEPAREVCARVSVYVFTVSTESIEYIFFFFLSMERESSSSRSIRLCVVVYAPFRHIFLFRSFWDFYAALCKKGKRRSFVSFIRRVH